MIYLNEFYRILIVIIVYALCSSAVNSVN